MALKIAQENDYGILMPAAYARISKVEATHPAVGPPIQYIYVDWYYDAAARQNNKLTFGQSIFEREYDDIASVSMADLYTWLKTQPNFSGAEDV